MNTDFAGLPRKEAEREFCLHSKFPPTDEQREVIFSDAPRMLVVAGAGSGKTTTVSRKIAWNVLRNNVAPERILGLTFSKKAAGELSDSALKQIRIMKEELGCGIALPPADGENFAQVSRQIKADMNTPQIATYNAFAADVALNYAMLIGKDPRSRLITDARRYQIMLRLVQCHEYTKEQSELIGDISDAKMAEEALCLAAAVTDNCLSPGAVKAEVRRELAALDAVRAIPGTFRKKEAMGTEAAKSGLSEFLKKSIESLEQKLILLDLTEDYFAYKESESLLEYSDQVAWATQIIEQVPAVAREISSRYDLVLLDEYQDTSVNQARFLHALFKNVKTVCAVGDPNQAIYGWRGAGANALDHFVRQFGVKREDIANLSVSFRNPENVLRAANTITKGFAAGHCAQDLYTPFENLPPKNRYWAAEPITAAGKTDLPLKELRTLSALREKQVPEKREGKADGEGEVCVIYRLLRDDTYRLIARRIKREFTRRAAEGKNGNRSRPTAAILVRSHKFTRKATEQLSLLGLKYEVIANEPLIKMPEIRMIRALLGYAAAETRGDCALMLCNYFALGATDLYYLSKVKVPDLDNPQIRPALGHRILAFAASSAPELGEAAEKITSSGAKRIRLIADLRQKVNLRLKEYLPDLIRYCARLLQLPQAAAARAKGGTKLRNALQMFGELAAAHLEENPGNNLDTFLTWVDTVEEKEKTGEDIDGEDAALIDMADGIMPQPGTVQILTMHAAKGLEWDIVALPELVENVGRKDSRGLGIWQQQRKMLPSTLRLDRDYIPVFSAAEDGDLGEYDFSEKIIFACKLFDFRYRKLPQYDLAEKRRLAYVAYTRTRDLLILAAHAFRDEADLAGGIERARKRNGSTQKPEDAAGKETGAPASDGTGEEQAEKKDFAVPMTCKPDLFLREIIAGHTGSVKYAPENDCPDFICGADGSLADDVFEVTYSQICRWAEKNGYSLQTLGEMSRYPQWPKDVDRTLIHSLPAEEKAGAGQTEKILSEIGKIRKNLSLLGSGEKHGAVPFPDGEGCYTASEIVALMQDPGAYMRQKLRPLPRAATRAALTGTEVHAQIAAYFGHGRYIDPDELNFGEDGQPYAAFGEDGQSDAHFSGENGPLGDGSWAEASKHSGELMRRFTESEFARFTPLAIEQPVELVIAGKPVRCTIDAVFDTSSLAGYRKVTVVDWKTGCRPPSHVLAQRQYQLALYRHAWAHSSGVPEADIDAFFCFLGEKDPQNRIVRAGDITLKELEEAVKEHLLAGWSELNTR